MAADEAAAAAEAMEGALLGEHQDERGRADDDEDADHQSSFHSACCTPVRCHE